MKQSIRKVLISVLVMAVFFGSSVGIFAATKTVVKPSSSKTKVTSKKATSAKKTTKKKTTKKKKTKKKRKEKLVLNPPLIDPLHPPGGR